MQNILVCHKSGVLSIKNATAKVKIICCKIHSQKYVLTFARLSIGAQAVTGATATAPGLMAPAQKADMGTSTWLSV